MKYIIIGDDAKEYGPIDAETLRKWVENGRVMPHTQVRNALLKNKWGKAGDLEFLHDAFAVLDGKRHEEAGVLDRVRESLWPLGGGKTREKPKQSTFRHAYIPQPASPVLRALAWIFDQILLVLLGAGFATVFRMAGEAGFALNPTFHAFVALYIACVLLYYGIALGIYAQTIGMWFWGIMLAKAGEEETVLEEVYLLRAYCFTLAMFLFGVLLPLAVLMPRRRAIHDLLTGCVVVGVAAKPRT